MDPPTDSPGPHPTGPKGAAGGSCCGGVRRLERLPLGFGGRAVSNAVHSARFAPFVGASGTSVVANERIVRRSFGVRAVLFLGPKWMRCGGSEYWFQGRGLGK